MKAIDAAQLYNGTAAATGTGSASVSAEAPTPAPSETPEITREELVDAAREYIKSPHLTPQEIAAAREYIANVHSAHQTEQ